MTMKRSDYVREYEKGYYCEDDSCHNTDGANARYRFRLQEDGGTAKNGLYWLCRKHYKKLKRA